MAKKLSILICSLANRAPMLNRLMRVIQPQVNNDVEVLVERDSGQTTIGAKRNKLLRKANGLFI